MADYIGTAISSVLRQNFTDFELLIGEDHSTDDSRKIIQSFRDDRIRCFYRDHNLGLFQNLNKLIKETQSPLIHFLNADDVLEPNCLQEAFRFFKDHSDIDISFCKTSIIDREGCLIKKDKLNDLPVIIKPSLAMQLLLYYGCIFGSTSSVCIRKKCFELFGLFDETLRSAGDYEMWSRVCRQKNLGVIHKHMVKVRAHSLQISKSAYSGFEYILINRKIYSDYLPMVPKKIRQSITLYKRLRQDVLHAHHCLRCLTRGELMNFLKIISIIGAADFTLGVIFWLLTLNNHLYRPKPRFAK